MSWSASSWGGNGGNGGWGSDQWSQSSWDTASWEKPKGQRGLKRKTTEDGKSYNHYTYVGGNTKASLPDEDKSKLLAEVEDGVVEVEILNSSSEWKDAAIYCMFKTQPTFSVSKLSVWPTVFREKMKHAYISRMKQPNAKTLTQMMEEFPTEEQFISYAKSLGFIPFQGSKKEMKASAATSASEEAVRAAELAVKLSGLEREKAETEMETVKVRAMRAELEATLKKADPATSSIKKADPTTPNSKTNIDPATPNSNTNIDPTSPLSDGVAVGVVEEGLDEQEQEALKRSIEGADSANTA